MLKIALCKLPDTVLGIYGPDKNRMPERARYLHPDAAKVFHVAGFVVSDIFRSAEASLAAVKAGRGAQPPGYSAHNFGLAIDLDVRSTMKLGNNLKTKADLDDVMEKDGWFCHRRDHKLDHESWHYTFLGVGAQVSPRFQTIVYHTEARIMEFYGQSLAPNDLECQKLLQKIGLYGGALDGDIGPLSKAAVEVFRRGWGLYGKGLDQKTRRTLAYVACERVVTTP